MKRTRLWRCALLIIIIAFLLAMPACGKKGDPIPPKPEPPKTGTTTGQPQQPKAGTSTSTEQPQQPKTGTSAEQPQQPKTGTNTEQPENPAGGTPGK